MQTEPLYDWIHRNYHIKQKASAEDEFNHVMMSAILYKPHTEERRETEEDWGVLDQHDQYWKSLNLTEDWLRTILLIIIMSFKCVQSYNDWEVAFLKRRHRSWIELEEIDEKRIKSTLRFSIQHDKREATSVAKTLTELLNKQFIQVSNSFAAVSVLFVQKSEDELHSVWTTVTWTESLKRIVIFFH
jgi:hypothetical protein